MEVIRYDRLPTRPAAKRAKRARPEPRTVNRLMSRTPITVAADLLAMHAERIALSRGVHHLLVIEEERLAGIVCLCDLFSAQSHATVADVMTPHVATVDCDTTLEESMEMMSEMALGCLPVMEGESLVGVITRGDLHRAGVLTDQVIGRVCASCGTRHHVKFEPNSLEGSSTVGFCLQCLERGRAYDSTDLYDELGGGG